jgi:hypothetical protein
MKVNVRVMTQPRKPDAFDGGAQLRKNEEDVVIFLGIVLTR